MDEKQIKLTGGRRALAVSALVCAPQLPRPPSPPWAGRGGDSDGVTVPAGGRPPPCSRLRRHPAWRSPIADPARAGGSEGLH